MTTTRHAAKLPLLAKALGLPATRRQLDWFKEWMRWPGFPAKTRHGWPIDGVREWLQGNAEEIHRRYELARLASGKGTARSLEVVQTDAATGGANGAAVLGVADLLGPAQTQAALARMLANHYAGKLAIEITPQIIHEWKTGNQLPDGCPPPPGKVNGREWSGPAWVEWFDAWLLPHHGIQRAAQGELLPLAKLTQMRHADEIAELEHRQRQREIELGEYIKRDVAARTANHVIRKLLEFFKQTDERRTVKAADERLAELGASAEVRAGFKNWLLAWQQRITDEREAQCAAAAEGELGDGEDE